MRKFFLGCIITSFLVACSSSDNGPTEKSDNFDRGALLVNVADNIIIPAFEDLQGKLSALDVAREDFENDSNQTNLNALSNAWLEAYKVWQYVEMFNIGKAETIGAPEKGFVSFFNIYPLAQDDIENAASTGTYDLNTDNYHDAQGFPALDFLIHGIADNDTAALDKFTINLKKEGYVTYLEDVVTQMVTLNNSFVEDWKNGYRTTFVNATENSKTGSLNKLVNDFIVYYERGLRANKIGIPAGNFSNSPLPEKVETFYKREVSKVLALEGLNAVQDFFNGKAYNGNSEGESFKTYLETLNRNDIVTLLNTRFNDAQQKIQVLDDNFFNQINTDNTKMTQAYDALQSAVVTLKIDMVSAFDISLDFNDNDGD